MSRAELIDEAVRKALKRCFPIAGGRFSRRKARAAILDGQLPPGFRGSVLKAWDALSQERIAA